MCALRASRPAPLCATPFSAPCRPVPPCHAEPHPAYRAGADAEHGLGGGPLAGEGAGQGTGVGMGRRGSRVTLLRGAIEVKRRGWVGGGSEQEAVAGAVQRVAGAVLRDMAVVLLPGPLVSGRGNVVVGWRHKGLGGDGHEKKVLDTTLSTSYSTSLRVLVPVDKAAHTSPRVQPTTAVPLTDLQPYHLLPLQDWPDGSREVQVYEVEASGEVEATYWDLLDEVRERGEGGGGGGGGWVGDVAMGLRLEWRAQSGHGH